MKRKKLHFFIITLLLFIESSKTICLSNVDINSSLVDVTFTGDFYWQGTWFYGKYLLENVNLIDSQSGELVDHEITVINGHDLIIRCPNKNLGSYDSNAYSIVWDNPNWLGTLPSNNCLYISNDTHNYTSNISCLTSANGPYFLLTAAKVGSVEFNIYFGYWNRVPPGNGLPPYFIVQGQLLGHVKVIIM